MSTRAVLLNIGLHSFPLLGQASQGACGCERCMLVSYVRSLHPLGVRNAKLCGVVACKHGRVDCISDAQPTLALFGRYVHAPIMPLLAA